MDAEFCIQALEQALADYGRPEIFTTDKESQFTTPRFGDVLRDADVRISMDGRGRWMDNVFIERLFSRGKGMRAARLTGGLLGSPTSGMEPSSPLLADCVEKLRLAPVTAC